ncbi:chemotaxis-specific protein-glutamate methyltransferase CheB [Novosphingobium sp. G106]|uniref:chemotaxis-specific protein-glutamate methyltransferase CheB n=1 Tax=Novosphingobium sp. G106 TaxID=2849500 RepID=UPI001C2D2DE2|nr:chemotaxis-specific protein-glutamate methyltransferase CheB [Novosphingobium sp. G106]MBV1688160.1 chemotaxis-specific protein-glutamate methyltransferase CheB [Novosphingobium sp. G106]
MIKLLVVDDSPLMRRLLTEIFTTAGDFAVTTARSGAEALEMLHEVAPDVVTLDVNMPEMNGLACLDRIMVFRPCPVVMVSSLTAAGADETLEALALGAVDFIAKPRGAVSLEIDALAPELVDKVRAAASARIPRTLRLRDRVRARAGVQPNPPQKRTRQRSSPAPVRMAATGVVVVGSSTGGPPALDALLGDLPADFPWPIVIAQHMPASFTGPLSRRLDKLCAIQVSEITRTTPLEPGHAYIGKGDADLILSRRGSALVAMPAPINPAHFWHPSVDRLMESGLRLLPAESLIGVLMTGMGSDGAAAMAELKERGGHTIAESAETAVVWGMPGALVALGGASAVRPLDQIAGALLALVGR